MTDDSIRQPARWRATKRILAAAEDNYECGIAEPLNFDCADFEPFDDWT
jgi:hypothetical protein